jgi:hypothetical protein
MILPRFVVQAPPDGPPETIKEWGTVSSCSDRPPRGRYKLRRACVLQTSRALSKAARLHSHTRWAAVRRESERAGRPQGATSGLPPLPARAGPHTTASGCVRPNTLKCPASWQKRDLDFVFSHKVVEHKNLKKNKNNKKKKKVSKKTREKKKEKKKKKDEHGTKIRGDRSALARRGPRHGGPCVSEQLRGPEGRVQAL